MKLKYIKPKSAIRLLLKQNFHATHQYHRLRSWLEGKFGKDKVVIWQMGKVGSSTIWKSLESLHLDMLVYHVHFLETNKVNEIIERDRNNFSKLKFIYTETSQSEYLRSQLDSGIQGHWNIITLVRDPVAKTLSHFFQVLEHQRRLGFDHQKEEDETLLLQTAISQFHQKHVENLNGRHPFEWFNYELKENLHFDIFSAESLSDKDYCIYNTPNAKILLLKLETLNIACKAAFKDFLGIDDFTLVASNVGLQKRYGSLYRRFLDEVDLPISYLDAIYQTDLVKHFYSEFEIERFYHRWNSKRLYQG